jgi:hypothetical protein
MYILVVSLYDFTKTAMVLQKGHYHREDFWKSVSEYFCLVDHLFSSQSQLLEGRLVSLLSFTPSFFPGILRFPQKSTTGASKHFLTVCN